MKWLKILLISAYMIIAVPALGNDYIEGVNELGTKFKFSKTDWPIALTCSHYGGIKAGEFMLSIRKKKGEPLAPKINAWLLFPDHTGYSGELWRHGLKWRFDWTDRNTQLNYSIIIHHGGEGMYFQWSLADSKGNMDGTRVATCK